MPEQTSDMFSVLKTIQEISFFQLYRDRTDTQHCVRGVQRVDLICITKQQPPEH